MTHLLGYVTSKGKIQSPYYSRVDSGNLGDIFSLDLSSKLGQGIFGGKAVVYLTDIGLYQVAFIGNAKTIHHIDVLAAIIGEADPRAQGILHDDWKQAQDILDRSLGYELQMKGGIIIGMQQSSVMTDKQKQRGRYLPRTVQEDAFMAMIAQIDHPILEKRYQNLECIGDPALFL